MNRNHPKDVNLSYMQHLRFAWTEAGRLLAMAIIMLVHGVVPWIWDTTFSNYIKRAKQRIDQLTR